MNPQAIKLRSLILSVTIVMAMAHLAIGQVDVKVYKDPNGFKLQVNGEDMMINGMNWDYSPVGENYLYNLFSKSDKFIQRVLDRDMLMMKKMGVNCIRIDFSIPPKWVTYIYEKYGIYSMLNHTMGRYGYKVNGKWETPFNYESPASRAAVKRDILNLVRKYKDVPGVLLWALGNENNYGLEWNSFEIQNLPKGEREITKAKYLYSLFGELIDSIKAIDNSHPVLIVNGDVQYVDIIETSCNNMDILGTNVYRGVSATDLYKTVSEKLDKPVLFTEFGSDAYNSREHKEDQNDQAEVLKEQWKEVYKQSYSKGLFNNCIGGFTFQWADGWWKYLQEKNLSIHDTYASWANGGYQFDYVQGGANNMNEEWFGICAKAPAAENEVYPIYPRAAYYTLKKIYQLNPYDSTTTLSSIDNYFNTFSSTDFESNYIANDNHEKVKQLQKLYLSDLSIRLESVNSLNKKAYDSVGVSGFTSDHTESVYLGLTAQPTSNLYANVNFNVIANSAKNKLDKIFYENRGFNVYSPNDTAKVLGVDNVRLHSAVVKYNSDNVDVNAFYRSGHYHWYYEGDFMNLYPDASDMGMPDMYNVTAPFGTELTFKNELEGLRLAVGPQLYPGANPAAFLLYAKKLGALKLSTALRYDYGRFTNSEITSEGLAYNTNKIPRVMENYKMQIASVNASLPVGPFQLDLGGIFSGGDRVGQEYTYEKSGNSQSYFKDKIIATDGLGAKGKLAGSIGVFQMYAEGAYMGLIADEGADQTPSFANWNLKDAGGGNKIFGLGGLIFCSGNLQIGTSFLYQKPLIGPNTMIDSVSLPLSLRSPLTTPFYVWNNRETMGVELLATFDPTGATWFYEWDNDEKEDAPFAANYGIVYKRQPTSTDGGFFYDPALNRYYLFKAGLLAKDIITINSKLVFNFSRNTRAVLKLYGGQEYATGNTFDPVNPYSNADLKKRLDYERLQRTVTRYGAEYQIKYYNYYLKGFVKLNDWGPYDYNRQWNQTYPLQVKADCSYGFSKPLFVNTFSSIGVSYLFRTLDKNSENYDPSIKDDFQQEITGYVLLKL